MNLRPCGYPIQKRLGGLKLSSVKILGIPIKVGKSGELFSKCREYVGKGGAICTPNPIILTNAVGNCRLKRALLSADLCIPDGSGLLPYLRKADPKAELLPGVELGERLVSVKRGLSIGLVGGTDGVARQAFSYLAARAEGLRASFLLGGYETPLSDLLSAVKEERPDLCYICLGSPKQEILMHSLRAYSPKTLFLGLGGSLDVYAGKVKRAPKAMRKMHLEWLYRMLCEPRRFAALPSLLRFPLLQRRYCKEADNVTKKA